MGFPLRLFARSISSRSPRRDQYFCPKTTLQEGFTGGRSHSARRGRRITTRSTPTRSRSLGRGRRVLREFSLLMRLRTRRTSRQSKTPVLVYRSSPSDDSRSNPTRGADTRAKRDAPPEQRGCTRPEPRAFVCVCRGGVNALDAPGGIPGAFERSSPHRRSTGHLDFENEVLARRAVTPLRICELLGTYGPSLERRTRRA